MLISGISASCTLLSGCDSDTRIEDINTYYLVRVADENGTKSNIVKINNEGKVLEDYPIRVGDVENYSENYYENGNNSIVQDFSPIQFIPYTDIVKKDTYYEENIENSEENLDYISTELENYAFKTHVSYTFDEKTYEYQCHVYQIEDKKTNENRYVIGYQTIMEEKNPTQIYDALTASFIYLKTNEFATQVPSELDNMESFTLEEARNILENINIEYNGKSKSLTKKQ